MEPKSSTDRAIAAKEVQIVCLADTSARPDATGPGESFTKSITVIPVLMNRGYPGGFMNSRAGYSLDGAA